MQEQHTHLRMHPVGPRKQGFLHMSAVRRDSGNKIAVSAHGMGSGGLAVDAMAIGCLGMECRVERFFVLSHHFRAIKIRRCLLKCVTREEPGTLSQGAPVFPGSGSSRLGIEPKTPA